MKDHQWANYLFVILLVLGIAMFLSHTAKATNLSPFSDIEKMASQFCDVKSITTSATWSKDMAQAEKEIRESMLFSPQEKLQAKTNALLASQGFERLVLQCAIWRALGGESI